LQRRELEWVRVADVTAGRVDDLQLATPHRLEAFQFKFGTWPGTLTLNQLLASEGNAPPLIRSLADGWRERCTSFPGRYVVVTLATNHIASQHDVVTALGGAGGEKHFAAFRSQAWEPVSTGACSLESTKNRWGDTWAQIAEVVGFEENELGIFVRQCRLDFGVRLEPGPEVSARERDVWEHMVSDLETILLRVVGGTRREVEYSAEQLTEQLHLTTELRGVHRHEFRVNEYSYEPLEETERRLAAALAQGSSGYLALTGSPGSGKSSLLTRFLRSGRSERILRYYAYTPDEPSLGRGEAVNFLSDLVGELERQGVSGAALVPHHFEIEILRKRLHEQLRMLGDEFAKLGRRTLLLVDGLDHIDREQHPERSLVNELPQPNHVPDGVFILLGTQTPQAIPPHVMQSIRDAPWRHIELAPLPPVGVRRVLRRCGLDARLDEMQVSRVVERTDGHPLALGYLVAQLDAAATVEEINAVLDAAPIFRGHIEASYRAHWIALGNAQEPVTELLGRLARLRRPFDLTWVGSWAEAAAFRVLRTQFFHYFRRQGDQWEFFHQSFRLFVERESAVMGFGENDLLANRAMHLDLARHCSQAPEDSVWRREQLYHLAQAGEDLAVTALATREWFLAGFNRFATRSSLFADYWLAHQCAARAEQGLKVLQLALIKHELETRFDALELEDEVVLRVLLATNRTLALSRLSSVGNMGSASSLQAAQLLLEAGEEREALRLFLQARQTDTPRGLFGDHTVAAQAESLVRWALTGRLFLPMAEVLRAFHEHHFKRGEQFGIQPTREREPVNQERSRIHAIVQLAIALLNHDDPANATVCAEAIPWQSVSHHGRREFLLARAAAAQRAGQNAAALADLTEARTLPLPERSASCLLQMAELAFHCGAKDLALERLREVPPLDTRSLGAGRMETQVDPDFVFRWLRLSEALGATPPLSEILHEGDTTAEGTLLMARVRIFTAQIWAAAWRGEAVESAELNRRLSNLLRLLHQWPANILQWSGVRDMHEITWRATQLAPPACAAFGPPGLRLLEAALDEAWTRPEQRRYWLPENRRAMIECVLEEGGSTAWATRWLDDIGRDLDLATSAGNRVSSCTAQAQAWLAAKQPNRAANALGEALRLSFGIGYHKDYQLSVLIPLLEDNWRAQPTNAESQCGLIARSLHALRHETHGGGMWDAAEGLVETAFTVGPALGLNTWEFFRHHGPCSFEDALSAALRAGIREPCPDTEALVEIAGSLLVPLMEREENALSGKLFTLALRKDGREKTAEWADRFRQQVLTRSFPRTRRAWLMGLVKAGLDSPAILREWPESESESSVRATREIEERLAQSPNPLMEFRTILAEESGPSKEDARIHRYIDWTRVAAGIIPRLGAADVNATLELLGEAGQHSEAILAAVKRLLDLSEGERARALAVQCLEREAAAVRNFPDSTRFTSAHQALCLVSPDLGRRRWLSSLERHDWLDARQWRAASIALLNEEERIAFSGEISRYISALLDGCDADAPAFANNRADELESSGEALAEIILRLAEHPTSVVRHGAQRACLALVLSRNSSMRTRLKLALTRHHPHRSTFLQILVAAARFESNAVQPFCEEVDASEGDVEADVRQYVARLQTLLQKPSKLNRNRPANLDPAYTLTVPRFEPGIAVQIYASQMELVARHCQLPLTNLLYRLDRLHSQIMAEEAGLEAQRSLQERLRDAGLEFPFRNELAWAAERALMRVLVELHDAGLIDDEHLALCVQMFSVRDLAFIGASPETRPTPFVMCSNASSADTWSPDWLEVASLPDLGGLWRTYPGWRLLGAEHQFSVLADYQPTEYHWCVAARANAASASYFDRYSGPFVRAGVFSSEDFLDARLNGDGPVMRPISPQDLPSRPWLALVPDIALEMGWRPSTTPWFSWIDSAGRLMARSVWWMDGPVTYFGHALSQVAGEGWAVIVSESGWGQIFQTFGPLQLDHWTERCHERGDSGRQTGPRKHQSLQRLLER